MKRKMMKDFNFCYIPDKDFYICFTFTIVFILLVITTVYFILTQPSSLQVTENDTALSSDVVCYYSTPNHLNLSSNLVPDVNEIEASEDPVNGLRERLLSKPNHANILSKTSPNPKEMQVKDNLALVGVPPTVTVNARNINDGTDQEALRAVHLALELKRCSKFEKAKRLMQHAMALSPLHPEVLIHYAEFLEEEDICEADRLYTKAVMICPSHNLALANRLRTAPVVESMDQQELDKVDQKRKDLLRLDTDTPILKRLKKEVYFLHIHHTLAIEGNTMSLAETRAVAETGKIIAGKSIREHNEVLGLQSALKYVKSLVESSGPKTVSDVLQIHKRVLGNVDPLTAGTFRQGQVFVGVHVPPPASEVEELMEDFVDWLQSKEVRTLHPVKLAAMAHHRMAYIHPFVDGNGRTARLIMNAVLMGAGYPPVIIRKQDRSIYYDTLQMANEGDVRPFVRFLARCTECTLDVFLNASAYHDNGCIRALEEGIDASRNLTILL